MVWLKARERRIIDIQNVLWRGVASLQSPLMLSRALVVIANPSRTLKIEDPCFQRKVSVIFISGIAE
jgi:hypothetical protein